MMIAPQKSDRTTKRRGGRPVDGVVLLEVVIALAILILGMAAVGMQMGIGMRVASDSETATRAVLLAKSTLARLDSGEIPIVPNDEREEDFKEYPGWAYRLYVDPCDTPDLNMVTLQILYKPGAYYNETLDFESMDVVHTSYTLRATPARIDLQRDFPDLPLDGGRGPSDGSGTGAPGEGGGKEGGAEDPSCTPEELVATLSNYLPNGADVTNIPPDFIRYIPPEELPTLLACAKKLLGGSLPIAGGALPALPEGAAAGVEGGGKPPAGGPEGDGSSDAPAAGGGGFVDGPPLADALPLAGAGRGNRGPGGRDRGGDARGDSRGPGGRDRAGDARGDDRGPRPGRPDRDGRRPSGFSGNNEDGRDRFGGRPPRGGRDGSDVGRSDGPGSRFGNPDQGARFDRGDGGSGGRSGPPGPEGDRGSGRGRRPDFNRIGGGTGRDRGESGGDRPAGSGPRRPNSPRLPSREGLNDPYRVPTEEDLLGPRGGRGGDQGGARGLGGRTSGRGSSRGGAGR